MRIPTDASSPAEDLRSLESMEGLPLGISNGSLNWRSRAQKLYPGATVSITIALASFWLSQHYGAPVMLFALLLGMAFHFLHANKSCYDGIEFCSRTVLRFGVALLGLRITATQIASLGTIPIVTVLVGVVSTTLIGMWLGRRMSLGKYFGVLSGGAVAICGASAALAISTALPQYRERERDTILTVVGVTALSTIAMIVYPLIVSALSLSSVKAGIFLGGTIHDVAQVVGAGYMISQEAGDVATYVKLLRVATLIPVALVIAFTLTGSSPAAGKRKFVFPTFLAGFAILVAINSLVALPSEFTTFATTVSSWCLVIAISALGVKTSLQSLAEVGWRPVALMCIETAWIAALVLTAIRFV